MDDKAAECEGWAAQHADGQGIEVGGDKGQFAAAILPSASTGNDSFALRLTCSNTLNLAGDWSRQTGPEAVSKIRCDTF